MHIERKHDIDLDTFAFVSRERNRGETTIFRCGRDFIYYALHFYHPKTFNAQNKNPAQLERSGALGHRLPWWLMWSMLQFTRVPQLLRTHGLQLTINNMVITSWVRLVFALLWPQKLSYETVMAAIDAAIRDHEVIGVDLALKYGGLVDHVVFVYGYDRENVYVFDTNKVPALNYERVADDDRYIMKLPKIELRKRLGPFSRIWRITRR